ncbi:MAG: hypothetical protein ACTSR2_02515 [Candidatus Hodarchaeales archaeon]
MPYDNPNYPDDNQHLTDMSMKRREHNKDAYAKRVFVVNPVPLEVGDIQIGAVEIKDGDTDLRADVENQGSLNALVVENATELRKSTVNTYGDAIISFCSSSTLVSYPVPLTKTFKFSGFIVGGQADGEFIIKVNGGIVCKVRNSRASRTLFIWFKNEIQVSAGGTVEIEATNVDNGIPPPFSSKSFEGTINGYTLNI